MTLSRALVRLSLKVTCGLRMYDSQTKIIALNCRECFQKTFVRNVSDEKDNDGTKVPASTIFSDEGQKTKDHFLEMINRYKIREINRRGHVEFILGALKYMKEFGVERDLEVYRAIVDTMPKGKFVAENILQAEFMHYPKQQQCIIEVLENMEYYNVIPDPEFGEMLINIFGERGYPVRKFMRMLYWMPKFKNLSPWPLPRIVPKEPFELGLLAIKRIMSVDPTSKISVFSTRTVEDAVDDTWVISGQSKDQIQLLSKHSLGKAVYVEGAFRIWLRYTAVNYFVLRGDPIPPPPVQEVDWDDLSNLSKFKSFFSPPVDQVARVPTVHEQEDGVYYAVCATGTSSKDSLLSWIRLLQRENPALSKVPILFKLQSPSTELVETEQKENTESKEIARQDKDS